MLTVKC